MSRKDTILIAVLFNCTLLLALFFTASKKEVVEKQVAQQAQVAVEPAVQAPITKTETLAARGDEVDTVLRTFSEKPETLELKQLLPDPEIESKVEMPSAGVEVIVQRGDALEKIARNHQTTVKEIMALNHLTSTSLSVGQKLRVMPGKKTEEAPSVNQDAYYVVKSGDSPWTIAVKNKMKVEQLLELNHLDEAGARKLKPGDRLKIK